MNTQHDFDGVNRALHKIAHDNFWGYTREVAEALAHNGESGFELLLSGINYVDGVCIDNHKINDTYKGVILVETLCRLAYIADHFNISRVTVTRASEVGGIPVCYPYLLPKHGMPNVADADDKAYLFFVHTLIAQTKELVELHMTDRQ